MLAREQGVAGAVQLSVPTISRDADRWWVRTLSVSTSKSIFVLRTKPVVGVEGCLGSTLRFKQFVDVARILEIVRSDEEDRLTRSCALHDLRELR